MVITEVNLKELVEQYNIVPESSVDQFSVTLHLSRVIRQYNYPRDAVVTYGDKIGADNISTVEIANEYLLRPNQSILACSSECVNIPKGYIGFLQTKGSLARLFVTAHCCDGQIEPGFSGHITFEICNMGNLNIRLLPDVPVAQLFLFKCSSDKDVYEGQYNKSNTPTFSNPKK